MRIALIFFVIYVIIFIGDCMFDKIINNKEILGKELSLNIDSIFVEEDGKLDTKFYTDEQFHELRSCAKLVTAMATCIAIDRKLLTLDTKVYPIIKDVCNITNTKNINKIKKWTIKNLLTHTTGYEKQMFSVGFVDPLDKNKLLDYALNYDIPYEVGERYAYNNLEPFLISVIFSEYLNINLSDFVNENIFKKLDIKEYRWDNHGKYCMAATGLYLKHTDFHKLAKLLYDDGEYKGNQVIPSYWIKEICKKQVDTPNYYKPERVLPKIGAGYFTFISRDDIVFRDGTNGQYMIVDKNKKVLITIFATEKEIKNVTEILRGIV